MPSAPRLPWQHLCATTKPLARSLTFGHLIENHVDQDIGATPASAVTVNRGREMRGAGPCCPPRPNIFPWARGGAPRGEEGGAQERRGESGARGTGAGRGERTGRGGRGRGEEGGGGGEGEEASERPQLSAQSWEGIRSCAVSICSILPFFSPLWSKMWQILSGKKKKEKEKRNKEMPGSVRGDGICIQRICKRPAGSCAGCRMGDEGRAQVSGASMLLGGPAGPFLSEAGPTCPLLIRGFFPLFLVPQL